MNAAGRTATPRLTVHGLVNDHSGQPSRYLTDGVRLYRYVGTIPSSMGHMIGLENCHSLDLTLWPVAELHALQLKKRHSGRLVARVSRRTPRPEASRSASSGEVSTAPST